MKCGALPRILSFTRLDQKVFVSLTDQRLLFQDFLNTSKRSSLTRRHPDDPLWY